MPLLVGGGLLLSSSLLLGAEFPTHPEKPIPLKEDITKPPVFPRGKVEATAPDTQTRRSSVPQTASQTPDPLASLDRELVSELLTKMVAADQYLNYNGSFAYTSGGNAVQIDVEHRYADGSESERLSTRSRGMREVRRDASHVYCIFPDQKRVVVEPRKPFAPQTPTRRLAAGMEAAADSYEYVLEGKDTVAGQSCRKISIYPKDSLRYGYRLCTAEDSGMLLKFQTVDKAGQTVEQMIFTEFSMAGNDTPVVVPLDEFKLKNYRIIEPTAKIDEDEPDRRGHRWMLTDLPPGFREISDDYRHLASGPGAVQHLVVDDGLASVSVFIRPKIAQDSKPKSPVVSQSGALHSLSWAIKTDDGWSGQGVAMGEVPERTLLSISKALTRAKPSSANDGEEGDTP